MERAAATLGKSKKSVYALLKKHTGWSSGRKTRADKGETCVDRELALAVGGLSHLSERQTGKRITSIKAARERLAANGRHRQPGDRRSHHAQRFDTFPRHAPLRLPS